MPGVNTFSKSVSGFDPRSIPGCLVWLDAADVNTFTPVNPTNGASISQWRDKSGNSNHASQATSSQQPTYTTSTRVLNFNRAASQYFDLPNGALPSGNSSYTYFVLCSFASFTDALGLIGGGNFESNGQVFALRSLGTDGRIHQFWWNNDLTSAAGAYTPNINLIVEATYTSGGTRATLTNGTQLVSDTPGTRAQGTGNNRIGVTYVPLNEYLSGTIQEIIVYSNALTSTQRQAVEGYLAWKWNLEISPNFLPTSIPTPLLWFDAADSSTLTLSGSNVTEWRDKIRNFSMTSSNASYFPVRSRNGIQFNNQSGSLGSPTSVSLYSSSNWSLPTNQNSVFTVCAPDTLSNANDYRAVFNMYSSSYSATPNIFIMVQVASSNKEGNYYEIDYNGTSWNLDYVASPVVTTLGQPRLDTIIGNSNSTKIYTNSVEGAYMATTFNNRAFTTNYPVTNTVIGSGQGNRFFSGLIYEILVYSGALTEVQRRTVEGYLANKWNVANIPSSVLPQTHPFIQYTPTLRNLAPIDVPDCVLWLDGADGSSITTSGANVTGWIDKSGLGNSVTGISATAPTYSAASNGIVFSSPSSTKLQGSLDQTYNSNASVFVVTTLTSNAAANNNPRLIELGGATTTLISQLNIATYASTATPILATYLGTGSNPTGKGTNVQTYIDVTYNTRVLYTNLSTYNTGTTTFTNLTLSNGNTQTYSSISANKTTDTNYGSNYNRYVLGGYYNANAAPGDSYNGVIHEVVVFSRQLSTTERQTVEGYLAWKWNLGTAQPTTAPFYRYQPSVALPFSPLAITNCVTWVDASDRSRMVFYPGTSKLQGYIDKANNYSFSNLQGTSTYASTYQSNGFYSSNGTQTTNGTSGQEQSLAFSNITSVSATATTTVMVCKPDFVKTGSLYANPINFQSGTPQLSAVTLCQSAQPSEWFILNGVGPGYANLYNTSATTTSINVMTSGTTGGALFTNGTSQGTVSWSSYTAANQTWEVRFPDVITRGWTGYIYEAIIFSKVLSTTERQQIEGYLAWKWGTQTSLPSTHPYKKFPPGM